jgi:hypothetical protein
MSLKCEMTWNSKGEPDSQSTCPGAAEYIVDFEDQEVCVCYPCYDRLQDQYEGKVTIVARARHSQKK